MAPQASNTTSAPSSGSRARTCSVQPSPSAHTVSNPSSRASAEAPLVDGKPGDHDRGDAQGARGQGDAQPDRPRPLDDRAVTRPEARLLHGVQPRGERFEQCRLLEVHRGRHEMSVAGRGDRILGEGTRQNRGRCTEMETAGAARSASPAVAERVERDAIAGVKSGHSRTDLDHVARRLVAEHEGNAPDHAVRTELPFDQVQVGPAHPAGADPYQQLVLAGTRNRHLDHFRAGAAMGLGNRFHSRPRFASIRLDGVGVKD